MSEVFKVRRLTEGCCGMETGETYSARWASADYYVEVQLPSGEWTRSHWFIGHFERIEASAGAGEES